MCLAERAKQLDRRKIAAKVERAIRFDLEVGGVDIHRLARKHSVVTVHRIKVAMAVCLQPRLGSRAIKPAL